MTAAGSSSMSQALGACEDFLHVMSLMVMEPGLEDRWPFLVAMIFLFLS